MHSHVQIKLSLYLYSYYFFLNILLYNICIAYYITDSLICQYLAIKHLVLSICNIYIILSQDLMLREFYR